MSKELTMHGPVVVELKVHLMNPETEQRAVMTYAMPPGKYPSAQDIDERMKKLGREMNEHAPGFEPMDRREFMADILEERSGHRMHVACPPEFDKLGD